MIDQPTAPRSAAEDPVRAPRSSRRLLWLVIVGVLVISAAVALRYSPWAREYPLKRATLETLRLRAKASPQDPLVFFYLGTKAYNAQSLGEAGYCFQRAIELDPKMGRAYLGLAIVQRDSGKWPEAYSLARQAQQLNPKDVTIQYLIATLVMHTSQSKAVEEFKKVVARSPKWAEAWYQMGVCQEQINQKGEALTALRKAVELEPETPYYHRDLGKVLIETNFFQEARVALEKARALDKTDPQTCYLLSEARVKLAQNDADLRAADELIAESEKLVGRPTPENATVLAQLSGARAGIARRQRRLQDALRYAEYARKLNPHERRYLYDLADIRRALGQEEASRQLMAEYTALSAQQEAVFQTTERIKQDPKDPALRIKLARLYAQGKDFGRAVNQYEYCLYLDPKHAEARRELDALKRKLGSGKKPASTASPAPSQPASSPALPSGSP